MIITTRVKNVQLIVTNLIESMKLFIQLINNQFIVNIPSSSGWGWLVFHTTVGRSVSQWWQQVKQNCSLHAPACLKKKIKKIPRRRCRRQPTFSNSRQSFVRVSWIFPHPVRMCVGVHVHSNNGGELKNALTKNRKHLTFQFWNGHMTLLNHFFALCKVFCSWATRQQQQQQVTADSILFRRARATSFQIHMLEMDPFFRLRRGDNVAGLRVCRARSGTTKRRTLSVDFILQQLLHGLLLGDVQRRLAFAVHHAHVGALADEIPGVGGGGEKKFLILYYTTYLYNIRDVNNSINLVFDQLSIKSAID